LPRVLSPRLGRLCQHHRVAYQLDPNQTELTVKVASCVSVRALGGILCAKRSDTVGQPPSKFQEYLFLGKFTQPFCLQRRHVGHTDFATWGLANSIRSLSSQRYATVDLLLGPIRSPHKPVATRELRYQVHEANPAGTYLKTY
jgi:hypothetical protein